VLDMHEYSVAAAPYFQHEWKLELAKGRPYVTSVADISMSRLRLSGERRSSNRAKAIRFRTTIPARCSQLFDRRGGKHQYTSLQEIRAV
jgi:hypothetical protein